jgi:rhodanese-related sulfurtransferase
MQTIKVDDLAAWLADTSRPAPILLDVREPWEFDHGHLAEAIPMPMNSVPARCGELPPDRDVVCICHHGMRSMQVAVFLERQGFQSVHNLTGGMDAWSSQIDPSIPRY